MHPNFLAAKSVLESAKKIVIISHRSPDGDTVGANLALRHALQAQWKKEVISACIDPLHGSNIFLHDADMYVKDFDSSWPNAVVAVDCGASYMTAFNKIKPELFDARPTQQKGTASAPRKPFINIDHHASNDMFGTVNIVDPDAAAACLIVLQFLKFCGFTIDRTIATCLLHGMYYDTGSFMHSNAGPAVLQAASELMWRGADFKTIVKRQFHTMPVPQLRLYGKIMERAKVNEKGVTVSAVREEDFSITGAVSDHTTGAIDYLNHIPESEFCCLLYEERRPEGLGIKGSFRSRGDHVDLSRLAGMFGGGGHKKAAGFSLPGRLLEVGPKITIGS